MRDKKDEDVDPKLGKAILKMVEELVALRGDFDTIMKGLPKKGDLVEKIKECLAKAQKAAEQQQKFMDEVKKFIDESAKKK